MARIKALRKAIFVAYSVLKQMKRFISNRLSTQRHILVSDLSNESHKVHLGALPTALFLYSTGIAFLLFNTLLVTVLSFFVDVSVTTYHFWLGLLVALPVFYLFFSHVVGRRNLVLFLLVCGAIAFTALASTVVAGKFFDLTYDGQGYHQDTIVYLTQGWNPFYEALTPESTSGLPRWKWLNSYPKGSEELSAVIYKATDHIEQAKALNLLMVFMAYGFVLSLLLRLRQFGGGLSSMIAVLFVWNPVVVTQLFSFYIDGQLYLILLSIIAVLGTIYLTHKNYLFVPLTILIVLAWSLKLTGVMYSVFVVSAFSILFWYSEKVLFFFKKIQVGILASIIAVFIIGFNPYFTNFIRFGNPFYLPTEKTELVNVNIPENYFDLYPVERLIYSIFSKSDNVKGVGTAGSLKVPFTYGASEVKEFTNPDINVGGFGPLFGGIFLLSIIGILSIIFKSKYSAGQKRILYFLLVTVFISSIIIPPSSYARYIPQFWIFPVAVCLYALASMRFLTVTLGVILLMLIFANNILITNEYIKFNYEISKQLKENLSSLKAQSEFQPLDVSFGVFRQNRIRFAEAGIKFTEHSELPCDASKQKRVLILEIPESVIQICD